MAQNRIVWTNKSVLKFAGQSDPIDRIEAKARELVLRARDAGWTGPPYNPMAIADLLKIPVEANSEVADARTVPTGAGVKLNSIQPGRGNAFDFLWRMKLRTPCFLTSPSKPGIVAM